MRIKTLVVCLLVCATNALAQIDPVEFRVRCVPHPDAITELDAIMTRSLRLFAAQNIRGVTPGSIAVRFVPAVGNQRIETLRRSDLVDQWTIGDFGELQFAALTTNRCVRRYNVEVSGIADQSVVSGLLAKTIDVGGSYQRVLSGEAKIAAKRTRRAKRRG